MLYRILDWTRAHPFPENFISLKSTVPLKSTRWVFLKVLSVTECLFPANSRVKDDGSGRKLAAWTKVVKFFQKIKN